MQEEKSETAGNERQVLFPAIMSIGAQKGYVLRPTKGRIALDLGRYLD